MFVFNITELILNHCHYLIFYIFSPNYSENNELIVQLSKMRKGSVWNSVIASNENSLNSIDIVS